MSKSAKKPKAGAAGTGPEAFAGLMASPLMREAWAAAIEAGAAAAAAVIRAAPATTAAVAETEAAEPIVEAKKGKKKHRPERQAEAAAA